MTSAFLVATSQSIFETQPRAAPEQCFLARIYAKNVGFVSVLVGMFKSAAGLLAPCL
jgi:hypothetical protein